MRMQHRLAHRVGRSSQATTAAVDKPMSASHTEFLTTPLRGKFGLLNAQRGEHVATTTVKNLQIATPDVVRPVQSLSGGNQQRVLIGRWLTINPRVLILHGPTVGVDVGSKDTIYRIVQKLSVDGLAVIIISDDLPELLQNCDRILLMKKGHISASFDASTAKESDIYSALLADSSEAVPA